MAAPVLIAGTGSTIAGTWTGVGILESNMVSSSPPQAPVVACDAAGHAVAVWTSPSMGAVFTERYPGGSWSAAIPVIPGAIGDFPQVAIGPGGSVAASWIIPGQKYVPPKLVVAVRPAGGSFPAVATQLASGTGIFDMRLGVAGNGSVTIIWSEAGMIKTSTRSPAGIWSAPVGLSSPSVATSLPDLVVSKSGAALAVWQETPAGSYGPTAIGAAYRAKGAPWGAAQLISAGSGLQTWNPKPGIDAAGNVAVGYLDGNSMMLAKKPVAGLWAAPVAVSPAADAVYYPALAMDTKGNILAAWQKLDAGNYGSISKRIIPATGSWSGVTVLSKPSEDASWPMASIAGDGSVAAVTWVNNSTSRARAAIGSLTGAWTIYGIGTGWWNIPVPVAAGASATSAVWPSSTGNPNVTNMVANSYTP